ncbi:MAG: aspartate aminotransferase family protein [Planctomycetes bacterium]|nr:aspartate aminotransferase family protein [Planctomycetota bacterium]
MSVHNSGHVQSATDALLARREAVVSRGVPLISRFAVERGVGALLYDLEGRELIDLSSGIGVMNGGHSDPAVLAAISAQAAKLQHVCMHVATYEPYVALCERLVALLPHGPGTKAMLVNSGAEAVENAVKIARQTTGRSGILCLTGGYHGRTLLCMTLTSKVSYKHGCGPFAPEVYRVDCPDALRDGGYTDPEGFAARELAKLRGAFKTRVAASDLAAILLEPVLGEGGFVPLPAAYLRGLRELCDEHGILLIFDEVQSGFCRTGAWAAHQVHGVVPDLSTYAKAMGGGLPIAAVVGSGRVMDAVQPGTIGGTFGGNPIACAAALATIERLSAQDLCARARVLGERMQARLRGLMARHPEVVDVRGLGAMVAMELCEDGDLGRPAGGLVKEILAGCHARGALVISAGTYGNVIRLLPPLVITDEVLERGLDALAASVEEVLA